MKKYQVIGMMSGTSLDGVDLAHCTFLLTKGKWEFSINKAITISYPPEWKYNLKESMTKNSEQLKIIDSLYGEFLGNQCLEFMNIHNLKPELIASHGHTVFHQPEKGFTFQIGDGKKIAGITQTLTVYDFRSLDVKLGGQGAPLVPIGDRLLFSDFDFCLNLGGFANISFEKKQKRIAFDICPVNIVINQICETIGKEFDRDGQLGKKGKISPELLTELNNLNYYQETYPKSLGKEFVLEKIHPLLRKFDLSIEDKLHTYYEHIAQQISAVINDENGKNVLISGGGVYNTFLIEMIRRKTNKKLDIPSKNIIDFKEALIFAFLGVLRLRGDVNCLASVTGSSRDCSGGVIVQP